MSTSYDSETWRALEMSEELDVDGLTQSALSAFGLFLPFYEAKQSFEHRIVAGIVQGIIQQAELYFSAIGTTLGTALDGCTISEDALTLCQFLESGTGTITQLREYLNSMIQIAASARKRSTAAKEQFKAIRRELYKICSDIPSQVAQIQAEQRAQEILISNGVNSSFISMPLHFNSYSADLDREMTRKSHPVLSPEHQMKSFTDVLTDLRRASADLDQLVHHIGGFADWWQLTETNLIGLQSSINQLTLDGSNAIRHYNTKKRWQSVKRLFNNYSRAISYIQDMHPEIVRQHPSNILIPKSSRGGGHILGNGTATYSADVAPEHRDNAIPSAASIGGQDGPNNYTLRTSTSRSSNNITSRLGPTTVATTSDQEYRASAIPRTGPTTDAEDMHFSPTEYPIRRAGWRRFLCGLF